MSVRSFYFLRPASNVAFMSRPLRIEFAGAVYHVSACGNSSQPIFLKDGDRRQFLQLFGREIAQHRWLCHGYCLLTDQYRLLIETPEGRLGRGIGRLNAIYSQWFNRRHGRAGHLFQGRYKAIVLEKALWLSAVSRDLAWAPVRAGLVKRPGQWDWSSHRAIAKGRDAPDWLSIDWILGDFAGAPEGARKAYRAFVAQGKRAPSPWEHVRAQMYLGSQAFLTEMSQRVSNLPADQAPRGVVSGPADTRNDHRRGGRGGGSTAADRARPPCPAGCLSGDGLPLAPRGEPLAERGRWAGARLATAHFADPTSDRRGGRPEARLPLGPITRHVSCLA
jgi:putative transposase